MSNVLYAVSRAARVRPADLMREVRDLKSKTGLSAAALFKDLESCAGRYGAGAPERGKSYPPHEQRVVQAYKPSARNTPRAEKAR